MATINVSLPGPMKEWVDAQAKIAQFQKLIDDGLASGVSTRTIEELLIEARSRARVTGRDAL